MTQPEHILENELVEQLIGLGYSRAPVTDEASILANLQAQLEAFNQIQRYHKHSYWASQGLFNFIQLFVISNGVNTKYYANCRKQSFKQTFYWAAENNVTIRELSPFTEAFLNPAHLGAMIGKYMVLNETEKALMVLRPYQFYATEAIVERVLNPPEVDPNGYVWHTTGSGKTLTSFKAAQILTGLPGVHKVVFYVDKTLRYHGLIQAFSRTNRILSEVKSQGNIVVFRNLKKATDEAIALFSNLQAKDVIFVPPYDEYVKIFNAAVLELLKLTPTVKSVKNLQDEAAELKFVKIFRELMRLRNILESFSEFDAGDLSLTPQQFTDYRSAYLDLYDKVKTDTRKEKASILDDVDFELEPNRRAPGVVLAALDAMGWGEVYGSCLRLQYSNPIRVKTTATKDGTMIIRIARLVREFERIPVCLPSLLSASLCASIAISPFLRS